jgi:hypothetical protein
LPFGIGALILFDWNLTVAPGKIAYEAATKAKGANPVGEQPKFIGPPSRHWRSVRSLLTWQAACLVENVEPKWPIQDGDLPYAAMTALDTAIKDGVLHADSPSDYSGMSRIEKSDFIAYCRQLGEAPPIYQA